MVHLSDKDKKLEQIPFQVKDPTYPVYTQYGQDRIISSDDSVYSEETDCCLISLFKKCLWSREQ